MSPSARRSRRRGLLSLILAAALFTSPTWVHAQPRGERDITADLEQADREADQLTSSIDALTSDIDNAEERLAQVQADLEDARGRLKAAEGQVALAVDALEEANAEHARARKAHQVALDQLARTEAELETEQFSLTIQAAAAFKYGSTASAFDGSALLQMLANADDPTVFLHTMRQFEKATTYQADVVGRVIELRDQADRERAEANRLRAIAAGAERTAAEQLAEVERLRDERAAIAEHIAADEAEQAALLAALEADRDDLTDTMSRVEARQAELLSELSERRRLVAQSSGAPDIEGHCPVLGAVVGRDFINDWGFPRSGGRSHRGNDIFAPEGTPLIAIADGVVTRWDPPHAQTNLGGITLTYETADGSRWYNAHLQTIAAGIQPGVRISAGQTIGTVGRTGNARTTPPHNHIQRLYGDQWVNPFPAMAALCREPAT